MQLKEKKILMEKDKRKLESELEKQRQTISKQVFLQVVQKKQPDAQSNTHESSNSSTVLVAEPAQIIESSTQKVMSPLQALRNTSNASKGAVNSATLKIDKETPRRQWDKTQNFIDLENEASNTSLASLSQNRESGAPLASNEQIHHVNARASSTSSLSTPSSSASQSPPLTGLDRIKATNAGDAVDLSKAYYSRDEMLKTIDTLKEKYVKESSAAAVIVNQARI